MWDREAHPFKRTTNFTQASSVPGRAKDSSIGEQYEYSLQHDKVGAAS